MKNCKCECGNAKDYRAKNCRSCGSRKVAQRQWQRMRPQMEKSLRAFAATRKGVPIKPPRFCSVDECDRPHESHGWCHKHYSYWKLNGRPEPLKVSDAERFWSQVEKTEGCWLWRGSLNDSGYGMFQYCGRRERAHRYSFFLAYGRWPFPQGRHTCDNPPCVRPDHIVEGTQTQNNADRIERGRQIKGELVGGSKLTAMDVMEIKRLLKGKMFQKDIASMFGVHQTTVQNISSGKTWAHVIFEDEPEFNK